MKNAIFTIMIMLTLISCSEVKKKELTKADVIDELKKLTIQNMTNPKYSEDSNGNIYISENERIVTISPDNILIAEIDDDEDKDAIIKLSTSYGGNATDDLSLILLSNSDSPYTLELKPKEGTFVFSKIEDKTIYGEMLNYAEGDALCCPSIKEQKKYKVMEKKIVEIE